MCRNNATFARLAEPLGFVEKDDIFHVVKAIVATQRDYGRRDDRKQSRLKYLVNEWGIDKFRLVVEQYFGKKIQDFRYCFCQSLSVLLSCDINGQLEKSEERAIEGCNASTA